MMITIRKRTNLTDDIFTADGGINALGDMAFSVAVTEIENQSDSGPDREYQLSIRW